MSRKKRTEFGDSFIVNQQTYLQYIEKLTELSISMFDWQGLPESVDARYIELNLFSEGSAVYFRDEVMGDLCLKCIQNGGFDVYGNPIPEDYTCLIVSLMSTLMHKKHLFFYSAMKSKGLRS